jgi:hypothetical protein
LLLVGSGGGELGRQVLQWRIRAGGWIVEGGGWIPSLAGIFSPLPRLLTLPSTPAATNCWTGGRSRRAATCFNCLLLGPNLHVWWGPNFTSFLVASTMIIKHAAHQ